MWNNDPESERMRIEENEKILQAEKQMIFEENALKAAQEKKAAEEEGLKYYPHTKDFWKVQKKHNQPIPERITNLWPDLK